MSIKALHREIMLSADYRLSTTDDPQALREGRRQSAVLAREPCGA